MNKIVKEKTMKLKGQTEVKKGIQVVSPANSSLKVALNSDIDTTRSKKNILKDLKDAFLEVKQIRDGKLNEAKSFSELLDEI
jgi:hypothetical protein